MALNVAFGVCRCTFQRASENDKTNPNCVAVFLMIYFVLSGVCRSCSALLCSALLSFMGSRAAGWVGRGRREGAAGADGISLFDLI